MAAIPEATEEQSVSSQEILNNLNQAIEGFNMINENIAKSSSVSNEISQDISDVNPMANDISNSSSQVQLSADTIKEQSCIWSSKFFKRDSTVFAATLSGI